MRTAFTASMALALASCTHVATIRSQDVAPAEPGQAFEGASYSLPMIQYDIELTRLLDSCDAHNLPKFALQATATERYVAGESFEIDPTSLSSILKTSAMGLENHEDLNTLKSFNASADDKTGDILVAVARTGIAVAGALSGVPLAGSPGLPEFLNTNAASPKPRIRLICSAQAIA